MDNTEQERCPSCGRFLKLDPDGFYDRVGDRDNDLSEVVAFCDEKCADVFHANKVSA